MSRFIERMIENEIDSSNDHLPAKKISLSELIQSETPSFETRGGEKSRILVDDVEMLSKYVPVTNHEEIMLPIVILRRMDLGMGIYTVAGSKTELFLIHKILGQDNLDWDDLRTWKPIDRLARPQVQIIRRKLPSTTVLGFTTTVTQADDPFPR